MDISHWVWPPLHEPTGHELALLHQALYESDWSHTQLCAEFEQEFAQFVGARHAMLVPSGTAAIRVALTSLGVEPGAEVIVPGITWPSVISAIIGAGAIPRVVDIDPESLCMMPNAVELAISDRTFAVLATHIFGSQCDLPALSEIAARRGIHLLEDAAQSVGSAQLRRSCGTWGVAGMFSFNDRKVLACGEAGCVVTDSEELNEEMRRIQLIQPEREDAPNALPGTYKVSEFQAAVALGQLRVLPERLDSMSERADQLSALLVPGSPKLGLQVRPSSVTRQSYFNFCVSLREVDVASYSASLSKQIGLRISSPYIPLASVSDFAPLRRNREVVAGGLFDPLPNCEFAYYSVLRLPHRALLADAATIVRLANVMLELLDEG